MNVFVKREDPLRRRLRRMVREVIRLHHSENSESSFLAFITNKTLPLGFRALWIFMVLLCIATSIYLISDRILHYMDIPIAVDVHITEEDKFDYISITICTPVTELLLQKTVGYRPEDLKCLNQLLFFMDKSVVNDTEELWKLMNTSSLFMFVNSTARRHIPITLAQKEVKVPMGTCITFTSDKKLPADNEVMIIFRNPMEACEVSALWAYFQPPNTYSEPRKCYLQTYGSTMSIEYKVIKYILINRPGNKCGSVSEYSQCVEDCHQELYRSKLSCRFPFMRSNSKMGNCRLSREAKEQFIRAIQLSFSTDPYEDCGCHRPCIQHSNDFLVETTSVKQNTTIYQLRGGDNNEVIFEERVDYDFTALLCDIGGNLGLCLGLSLVSIIEALWSLIMNLKILTPAFSLSDPLYQITKRVFEKYKREFKKLVKSQEDGKARKSAAVRHLKFAYCCLATCVSLYLVYQRIEYYLQVPLKVVVDVQETKTVQFPKIAICGVSSKLHVQKRKLSKHKRLSDVCDIELWDILDILSLNKLWAITSLRTEILENIASVAEATIGKMYLKNVSQNDVSTPNGLCLQYQGGSQIYIGTTTMFAALSYQQNKDEICHRNYRTVYISPVESDYYITAIEQMPSNSLSYVYFQSGKVKRLNLEKNPCVESKIFFECKRMCLFEILNRIIPCRLPYMPASDILHPCNTSRDAKTAHYSYLNQSISLDADKDCKCFRQCEEIVYMIRMHAEPIDMRMTLFVFTFLYNITPNYIEEYAYTFIKLISDVGSLTGLLLGLSLIKLFTAIVAKVLAALRD